MNPFGRHRVAVVDAEEVVRAAVEERDVLALELGLHRSAVDVVDPVDDLARDLVVDRVGVRREEECVRPHLVVVDEEDGWVLLDELDLGVGLGLGAREPVAVHVEPVGVLAPLRLAPVRVLDGDDDDDRVVEDPRRCAVAPVGEVVEDAQRRVGAALLAPVHVRGDPENRGGAGGERRSRPGRRCRIHERSRVRLDGCEPRRADVLRLPDDRVRERPALDRVPEDPGDDARAGGVHRGDVLVGLRRGHLLGAEVEAEDVISCRHLAAEGRRRERVAGRGSADGARRPGDYDHGAREERGQREGEPAPQEARDLNSVRARLPARGRRRERAHPRRPGRRARRMRGARSPRLRTAARGRASRAR